MRLIIYTALIHNGTFLSIPLPMIRMHPSGPHDWTAFTQYADCTQVKIFLTIKYATLYSLWMFYGEACCPSVFQTCVCFAAKLGKQSTTFLFIVNSPFALWCCSLAQSGVLCCSRIFLSGFIDEWRMSPFFKCGEILQRLFFFHYVQLLVRE